MTANPTELSWFAVEDIINYKKWLVIVGMIDCAMKTVKNSDACSMILYIFPNSPTISNYNDLPVVMKPLSFPQSLWTLFSSRATQCKLRFKKPQFLAPNHFSHIDTGKKRLDNGRSVLYKSCLFLPKSVVLSLKGYICENVGYYCLLFFWALDYLIREAERNNLSLNAHYFLFGRCFIKSSQSVVDIFWTYV